MQAVIFYVLMPIIPLLVWRSYNSKKNVDVRKLAVRYGIYTLIMTVLSTLAMILLCDEGTSFVAKVDGSALFAFKFFLVQLAAAVFTAGLEWYVFTGKVSVKIDTESYRNMGLTRFIRKVLLPCGLYFLAAAVVFLNFRLMFDDVLWGDEAFSANTVRNGVEGILQIVHFWDQHPPLYYLWLRLLVSLLGHEGWVLHLASLIPFTAGILAAVILFRKRFGKIPTAFFVIVSGLAAPCLEYNLEVRMYALAFFGIAMAFYCSYRIMAGGRLAWICMVLWALVAAYSHYYGLVIGGILIFITGVAAVLRFRGKTVVKSILALLLYIGGYAPWLGELFYQASTVTGNWWNDTILSLQDSLTMAGAGSNFKGILLLSTIALTILLLLAESGFVQTARENGRLMIKIVRPSAKGWSAETCACAIGLSTVAGTFVFAYLLCVFVDTFLAQRYLYPLIALTALTLVMGSSGLLKLLQRTGEKDKRFKKLCSGAKVALVLLLCVFVGKGVQDYRVYSGTVATEKAGTEDILALMGDVDKDVKLVCNGVKHIGWTVLFHYFPDNEIISVNCQEVDADRFWYFNGTFLSEEELAVMISKGYTAAGYGERQLGKYPLVLYYFEK